MADLLSVVIGGVISLVGVFGVEAYKTDKYRDALYASLISEIVTILEFVEELKMLPTMRDHVVKLESGIRSLTTFQILQTYSTVFDSSAGQIGILGEEISQKIIRFHTYLKVAIENNDIFRRCISEGYPQEAKSSCQLVIKNLEALISLGNDITVVGKKSVQNGGRLKNK
ncbi:MAG: hypothetical protein EBU93_04600 [Chlamydiae bacterium]|nr:hypothetical protein [Chlamydiota bacterium]